MRPARVSLFSETPVALFSRFYIISPSPSYIQFKDPRPTQPIEEIYCSYDSDVEFIITYVFWVAVLGYMIFVGVETYRKFNSFLSENTTLDAEDIRTIKHTVQFLYLYPVAFLVLYLPIIVCRVIISCKQPVVIQVQIAGKERATHPFILLGQILYCYQLPLPALLRRAPRRVCSRVGAASPIPRPYL